MTLMDTDLARMKAILVLTAAIAFAVIPFVVPFDGFEPGAYPVPQDDPPVQPAGYAFGIWGPIYLWLLASAVFGLFARADDEGFDRVRWPLFVSLSVGAAWLPVAQRSPEIATVLIWVMLGAALLAVVRAPSRDSAWLAWPLGLYAGWLTAASAVSIGLLAAGYGLLGPQAAAVLALAIAVPLAWTILARSANPFYGAAVIWALVGLVVQNAGGPVIVAALAGLGAAGLAALLFRTLRPA